MTRDYQFLLDKYQTKQPGEPNTTLKEYGMQTWRTRQRIRTCQNIMDQLNIQGGNRERCIHIVKTVPYKQLHRNGTEELITTAICFYIKKLLEPNADLEDYSVCKVHGLTYKNYTLIITRLCDYYQKNSIIKQNR